MSASVQIGLVMALLCAFTSILGFLYKHRGAVESPPISLRKPGVQHASSLFRSRWWLLGIAVAMVSWGFHVAALALAPISIVQTVIAGGLVLLGVVADRLFGFEVTRREWIGVALTAAGLAFLAAMLDGAGRLRPQRLHAAGRLASLRRHRGRRGTDSRVFRAARFHAAARRSSAPRPASCGAPRTCRSRRSPGASTTGPSQS